MFRLTEPKPGSKQIRVPPAKTPSGKFFGGRCWLNPQHDFAELLLVFEPLVRRTDFGKRENAIYHGFELLSENKLQHGV